MIKKYFSYNKDFFIQDELTYIQALPFMFHYDNNNWLTEVVPGTLFKLSSITLNAVTYNVIRPVWTSEITLSEITNIIVPFALYICLDKTQNNLYNNPVNSVYTEWGNFLVRGSVNWSRILVWDNLNNRFVPLREISLFGATRYATNHMGGSSVTIWNPSLNNMLLFRAHPRYRNIAGKRE